MRMLHVVAPRGTSADDYQGRGLDPCCGSGGMFVSSERFIEEHRGRVGDISIYGQESNYTTWRLANMNPAIRGQQPSAEHRVELRPTRLRSVY